MSDQPCRDGSEVHLLRLQDELAKRGLKSEVDTRGVVARLRVFRQGELHDVVADFQNTVLAACFGQDLWYAWPWAEPIARAAKSPKQPTRSVMRWAQTDVDSCW